MSKYTVVVAGSTNNTLLCIEALARSSKFEITSVVTPSPRPTGRKKEIKNNPVHEYATRNGIPFVLVDRKIDTNVRDTLLTHNQPDLLLVVDFGYLVPSWLLSWPKIGPVNIHPSDLPKYRGSSPGQFTLVFGETESAVSIIRMDKQLDHGPIIEKLPFKVGSTWTATDYYEHGFELISQNLADVLSRFIDNETTKPQPEVSPTPLARTLLRDDGFVPEKTLQALLNSQKPEESIPFLEQHGLRSDAQGLFNLWRGLTPWPGIWTIAKKNGKEIRMKLLELTLENNRLSLKRIQFEGKLPQEYREN